MPRTCTVCTHPQRDAIDRALVAGESIRGLSSLYIVSQSALARHRDNHLPATLVRAEAAAEVARGDDLLDQVDQLLRWARGIIAEAAKAKDLRTALQGIREARGCLELMGQLMGELEKGQTVNVLVMPEWIEVRAVVVGALAPYPEARAAVATALEGMGRAGK